MPISGLNITQSSYNLSDILFISIGNEGISNVKKKYILILTF